MKKNQSVKDTENIMAMVVLKEFSGHLPFLYEVKKKYYNHCPPQSEITMRQWSSYTKL